METGFCAFSGHRSLPRAAVPLLRELTCRRVEELADSGSLGFLCGGALGFDTLAAEAVLSVRARCPAITLTLALPCPGQHLRWPEAEQRRFAHILEEADEVVYVSPEYHRFCMLQRNRFLVDHSGLLLCYLTQEKGGTAYTVRYALKSGVPVRNLAVELDF